MIKVKCKTEDGKYLTEVWPKTMCCTPDEGEYVKSKSGTVLRIRYITHCPAPLVGEPYLEITLR